MLKQIIG
jgi:magnesium-transporting ATPase (P-type)